LSLIRASLLIAIPGCVGEGAAGTDYCYQPRNDTLRLRSIDCHPDDPCEICQGACETDLDCDTGLSCFLRTDSTPVPGCEGAGVDGRDYCYETPKNATNEDTDAITTDADVTDDDATATADDDATDDDATATADGDATATTDGLLTLTLRPSECNRTQPCAMCEGLCRKDGDCEEGLQCFRRPDLTPGTWSSTNHILCGKVVLPLGG